MNEAFLIMEERIDIVDKDGSPTGRSAFKSEIHKNGWYHNTIHVWLYTKDGDILLQQRSRKKTIHPLLWDVSVAGHIDAGETFIEAALRETNEEIGLELKSIDLLHIGTFLHESSYNDGAIKDNEFHQVYVAELKKSVYELQPQENEVEALKLVTPKEFLTLLQGSENNHHFISSNKTYYEFVLKKICNLTS